ncbi:MAG: helix-turn-helix transcriptional regulator [Muribaculaceae bacterium]|nr:helix-turn-helix transcriptional regulator [Muribaculaceae bacterium]
MENDDKNPVLDRLILFINSTGLSSTQFADKTGIPRPSLSQMLHGRNKSVNNQVLAKLNAAFPELNILWLLFGRGDMLQTTNIETSELQNMQFVEGMPAQATDNEATSNYDTAENANLFSFSNRTNEQTKPNTDPSRTVFPNNKTPNDNYSDKNRTTQQTLAEIPNDDTRQISSIIVLYTDGSFETFRPQNS